MTMEVLIFDTETVPDRKLAKPEEIVNAKGEPIFPKSPLHAVKAIAYARFVWEGGVPVFKTAQAGGTAESTEPELLSAFWGFVDRTRPLLVSWHGRGFDLQVLLHRAMHHRISAARSYFHEENKWERYRHRYSETTHLDLADTLCEFGAGQKFSLDLAARMVGAPGKIDTDGSKVEEIIEAGRIHDVRSYCIVDCLNLSAVYLRWISIQGKITFEQEDSIKSSIIKWIDEQPDDMAEVKKFGRLWSGQE